MDEIGLERTDQIVLQFDVCDEALESAARCSGPIRSPIGYVPRCISVPGRSDLLQNPVSDLVGAVFHFVAFVIAKPLAAILRRVAIAPACRFDVDRSCTVSRHSGGKALASIRYNTRRDLDFLFVCPSARKTR